MFLRKLFNSENRLFWVVVDLLIVIIGVYCAFLIQEYAENQKTIKQKDKILSALKMELEFFRIDLPGRGGYSEKQANEWQQMYNEGDIYNYSTWRFIEPQYNYQVLEHAINTDNTDIIDFDLYKALQRLYVQIKRIEHSERIITEVGMRHQSFPSSLQKGTPEYDLIWVSNYDNFRRLIQSMNDRAGDQKMLGTESNDALKLVNARLAPERKKEIEIQLIVKNINRVRNEEEAVIMISQLFPDFTEQEIRQLFRDANPPDKEDSSETTQGN